MSKPDNHIDELGAILTVCPDCNGDGYTAEHEPGCDGNCNHCPVQVQCERCYANGYFVDKQQLDQYYADFYRNKILEAEMRGEIKSLSHVLVHGATGRKHIGLSRSYVVSYLAEKQQDQNDLWEARPKDITAQFNSKGDSDE